MENLDMKMRNIFINSTFKITDSCVERINNTLNELPEKRNLNIWKFVASFMCVITLITGVSFAKEIKYVISEFLEKNYLTSIDNGYIYEPSEEESLDSKVIDGRDVELKLENIIMTDSSINILWNLSIEHADRLIEYTKDGNINYEKMVTLDFPVVIMLDENNKLVYSTELIENKEINGVEVSKGMYKDFNIGQINIKEVSKTENKVKFTVLHQVSTKNKFSNVSKLNIYIEDIGFHDKYDRSKKETLKGKWNIFVDIPEIMQNRENVYFEVVSVENKDFEIYDAYATPTHFVFGMKIKNYKRPETPKELINPVDGMLYGFGSLESLRKVSNDEEFERMYVDYHTRLTPISIAGLTHMEWLEPTSGCYIENSKGEKFSHTTTGNDNINFETVKDEFGNSIEQFDFRRGFKMTTYDVTDEITMIIDFLRKPVEVKLKRIR